MGFGGGFGADGRVIIEAVLRDKASAALAGIQSKMTGFGNNLVNLGSRIRSAGQSLTIGLTVPIVAFGVAMGRAFFGFEDAMARVAGLTNASKEQIAEWREEIMAMAPDVAIPPTKLADALFFVATAGLAAEAIIPTLRAIGLAAAAGLGETEDLAILASAAINAYGADNMTAADAIGIMVAAVREGNAETGEFAGNIGRLLPMASELDIPFHDVAAAVASLTLQGADAGEATTFLLGIFRSFMKSSPQLTKALGEIGLTFEDIRASVREKGLLATLADLNERMGDNEKIAGQLFPRIRGLTGFFGLLGDNAEQVEGVFGRVAEAGEQDLITAFEKTETEGREFRRAMVELNIVMTELGATVIPVLVDVLVPLVDMIGRAVDWFNGLPEPVRMGIIAFVALLAILGPLLIVIGALIVVVGAVSVALGITAGTLGLIVGGIALVLIAVAALIALGILLWQNWDTVTEALNNALDALREIPVVGQVIEHFLEVFGRIRTVAEDVISFFTNVFQGDWSAAWEDIKNIAIGMLVLFLDYLTVDFSQEVIGFFTGLGGRIANAFTGLVGVLTGAGRDLMQGLLDGIREHWRTILFVFLTGIPGLIVAAIIGSGLLTRLFAAGADLLNGLWRGATHVWNSALRPFLSGLPSSIIVAIGAIGGLLYAKGQSISRGLWQGIADAGGRVVNWARNLGRQVHDLVGNLSRTLFWKGVNLIEGFWDGLRNLWSQVVNWLRNLNPAQYIPSFPDLTPGFDIPGIPGIAQGTSFVPRDMLAVIHKGEMVIPRSISDVIRGGGMGGGMYTINFNGPITQEAVPDVEAAVRRVIREHTRRS